MRCQAWAWIGAAVQVGVAMAAVASATVVDEQDGGVDDMVDVRAR